MLKSLWRSPWTWRGFRILGGLLGMGIFIRSLILGGWLVYVGIASLLVGLIVASLVTRRW